MKFVKSTFNRGQNNNYLIAGNVCNAFALGELGADDDFFLIGAEPEQESDYPLLTGTILDSEKNVLFRLVRNVLIINPGHCSRIKGDSLGYEIHDSAGNLVFAVSTKFEPLPGESQPCYVTTLKGNFYDKHGRLAFRANTGDPNEVMDVNTKHAFGFGGLAIGTSNYSEPDGHFAAIAVQSGGKICKLLTGVIDGQTLSLDGCLARDVDLRNCTIHIADGNFACFGFFHASNCGFQFSGNASNLYSLFKLALAGGMELH